jgi:hypothetical protein
MKMQNVTVKFLRKIPAGHLDVEPSTGTDDLSGDV